ncbi:hypothetical protein LSTR_LSTR004820 [Laodelphax striatellus]|uniref:Uncharacterized protein n=1 Tax=Laodelphax striatellus TaxID=195883 RepID=A0A482WI03_LAOST|nr:hypothetical protein LSTR_LSTR004820 [Laodelphax striatellus]
MAFPALKPYESQSDPASRPEDTPIRTVTFVPPADPEELGTVPAVPTDEEDDFLERGGGGFSFSYSSEEEAVEGTRLLTESSLRTSLLWKWCKVHHCGRRRSGSGAESIIKDVVAQEVVQVVPLRTSLYWKSCRVIEVSSRMFLTAITESPGVNIHPSLWAEAPPSLRSPTPLPSSIALPPQSGWKGRLFIKGPGTPRTRSRPPGSTDTCSIVPVACSHLFMEGPDTPGTRAGLPRVLIAFATPPGSAPNPLVQSACHLHNRSHTRVLVASANAPPISAERLPPPHPLSRRRVLVASASISPVSAERLPPPQPLSRRRVLVASAKVPPISAECLPPPQPLSRRRVLVASAAVSPINAERLPPPQPLSHRRVLVASADVTPVSAGRFLPPQPLSRCRVLVALAKVPPISAVCLPPLQPLSRRRVLVASTKDLPSPSPIARQGERPLLEIAVILYLGPTPKNAPHCSPGRGLAPGIVFISLPKEAESGNKPANRLSPPFPARPHSL